MRKIIDWMQVIGGLMLFPFLGFIALADAMGYTSLMQMFGF